jgi:hypothetical protein
MVMGHTLHAVLTPEAWKGPILARYWQARGFTAPLFLLVSGWAVTLAISRSGTSGWAIPRGRLRRVLVLLAIGYGLRWPGWALDKLLAGDRDIWAKFFAFDALHCIAVSLLATSLVLALPLPRYARAAVLAGLAAGAVLLGAQATTPGAAQATAAGLPHSLPLMALAQAVGGTSDFPLFPWAVYFFAGTVVGLVAPPDRRGAAGIAGAAAVLLVVATRWGGLGTRAAGDPVLIAFRIGVVLAALAVLWLVPAAAARFVAPLGKSSLAVYAIHLPIVYGWYAWQYWFPWYPLRGLWGWDGVGSSLGPWAGFATALAVLVGSFALYRLFAAGWRRARSGELRVLADRVQRALRRVGRERR